MKKGTLNANYVEKNTFVLLLEIIKKISTPLKQKSSHNSLSMKLEIIKIIKMMKINNK